MGGPSWLRYLYHRMLLKHQGNQDDLRTDLKRCLSTWQLTLLGIGSTIGVGIYVMLGVMAKDEAGPSVVFSFIIAILVTLVNALVYAEFATFVPQTGASYIYLFKAFGEYAAFLMGSITIQIFLLSSSVGARAWSGMLDSYFNNTLQDHTTAWLGKIQFGPPFSENLDVVAFIFQVVITVIVSCNILCTSIINTVLGIMTSAVLVFVFIVGVIYGDPANFLNAGHGGIFPFGIVGVVKAASLALYATSGFDTISMSSEEAKNPAKSVPRAMIAELTIVGLVYIGAAVGMLFLIPYWMIDLRAPLPSAFEHADLLWGRLVVTIGPMFGITNLQMLSLYALSRTIYRMAKDGLFFSFFLNVDKKTGVPQRAVIFAGIFQSFFSLVLDLSYVVKMNVVFMLVSFISVGPGLIKTVIMEREKLREPSSKLTLNQQGGQKRGRDEEQGSHRADQDFFEHEIIVHQNGDSGEVVNGKSNSKPVNTNSNVSSVSSGARPDANTNNIQFSTDDVATFSLDLVRSIEFPDRSADDASKKTVPHLASDSEISPLLENFPQSAGASESHPHQQEQESETSFFTASSGLESSSLIQQDTGNAPLPLSTQRHLPVESASLKTRTLDTYASRFASWLSPFVPGILPANAVILLHLISCLGLSAQVIYGEANLAAGRPVAVINCGMLSGLVVVFSCFLWGLCDGQARPGFQTPLMPLVPTLSMILSSMMLFSAAEKDGIIEVIVMVAFGTSIYLLLTLVRYRSSKLTGVKGRALQENEEQTTALISPDGVSGTDLDDGDDDDDTWH